MRENSRTVACSMEAKRSLRIANVQDVEYTNLQNVDPETGSRVETSHEHT